MELETLKIYIKTHLKTGFIRPSKSPVSASILFDKKHTVISAYVLIIEAPTILQSKTDTFYPWSESHLTG